MFQADYRTALRAVVPRGNRQMSEDEVRERVDVQEAYCPKETAVARLHAWWDDDPFEEARALGGRLWLAWIDGIAPDFFPPVAQMQRLSSRVLPDAHVEVIEDGIISRPDLTAGIVRRISAKA